MALRVWLPLNGTLENKGISNVTVTNNNVTIDNNGKIGKCYYFNGSSYCYENTYDWSNFNTSAFSLCCWYKEPSPVASGNSQIICIGTSSGWNNIRIGLLRRTSNGYPMFSVSNGSSAIQYSFTATNFSLDVWNHIAVTYNNGAMSMYINGVLDKTMNTTIVPVLNSSQHLGIGSASNGAEKLSGYLNDVRIYDHCLSPLEVKEISQGLVLHYKLDQNLQILDNCYSYPTFDTSSANGGWSHWGRSGHVGNQGQNTDKTYIYNKENTYSHWVSNGETATGEYLVYQSPAFDGGYRSLQAIIKEENSKPIDETICFPDWNARNGGTPIGLWTSIVPLGDGFYLCKCEGISQDGSNDLVGIFVKPGYKIYLSEAYLENNKQLCSEILYPRNYIIDSSGYGNDGIIINTISAEQNSPRYQIATHISSTSSKIRIDNLQTSGFGNSYTFAWWAKISSVNPMHWGFANGIRLNGMYTGRLWNTGDGSNNPLYNPGTTTQVTAPTVNTWHHWAMVGNGSKCLVYQDGQLWAEAKTYKAISGTTIYINGWDSGTSYCSDNLSISDFRIYATALSAEDIADLYHTPASIDNLGNAHAFELVEQETNIFKKENIEKYNTKNRDIGIGEWVLRNGEWSINIRPEPFYKNNYNASVESGMLMDEFLPNTQYIFDMWIDLDDVIYNGNYVGGGFYIHYTDNTRESCVQIGGNGKGFQHFVIISNKNKSISHLKIYYYMSGNVYYRWDSIIKPYSTTSFSKEGINYSYLIENNDKFSIENGGCVKSVGYIEK